METSSRASFFDHVLRSDEDTDRLVLYILGNPVRAGLVKTIGEYPYAGCPEGWFDFPEIPKIPEA